MNEAKRAAVVKRGADRDHADLFASRPADLGSVKQTLRPPPPTDGGVAARNETSVLFTVDALRGAARVKTPEPEAAPLSSAFMASDDEGVIDLNALASSPAAVGRVGARPVPSLFPSDPPPAAFAADVSDSGAHQAGRGFKFGKRAYAGIAAAAVAVVLCSVGLAAAFKGEEPVVRTSAAAPVAPPPAPVVTAAPPAAAPAVTSVATSSSDEDTKTSSSKPKAKNKSNKAKAGSSKASSASTTKVQSSGVTPAPTPKAADKCGCKGDFTCVLRCTAKGS